MWFVTDVIDTRLSYDVSIMQKATFWLFLKEFMWRSRYDCMSFTTKENIILDYYWCQFLIGTVSWLVYLTVDWLLILIDIPRHFHPRKSQQITREMERVDDRAVIPPQIVIINPRDYISINLEKFSVTSVVRHVHCSRSCVKHNVFSWRVNKSCVMKKKIFTEK